MFIPEEVSIINKRLKERYGLTQDGKPNWQVIWTTGVTEKRIVTEVGGIQLLYPEARDMLKYEIDQDQFALERYTLVVGNAELVENFSYEPIWIFKDKDHNPLPPKWESIEFLVTRILDQIAAGPSGRANYQMPAHLKNDDEGQRLRMAKIHHQLYGNETSTGDSLALGEGVGYTGKELQ